MNDDNEVQFSTKLKRPEFLRIGIVVACGVILLVSAAVTMAASPSAAPGTSSPAAGQSSPAPGRQGTNPGNGHRGFGGMGPWMNGQGMPGMPGLPGMDGMGGRGFGHGRMGFGQITISSIDGSSLSLKTADGWTRTISVTGATAITRAGQTIGLGDLKAGDAIRFSETRNSDGTYTINAIEVVLPEVAGSVTGLTDAGFTVKSVDGATWMISVTGSTTYSVGRQSGSRSDVKVGDEVVVQGTQAGVTALAASTVRVSPATIIGQVTAKSDSTITVRRLDGTTATIHVDSGTTYQAPGTTNAGLANVTVGSMIAAAGGRNADGSLNATVVRTGPGAGMGRGWFGGRPDMPGTPAAPGSTGSANQG